MTTTTTTIYSYFTYMSVGRRSEWFDISDDYYYYHPQPKKETLYLPHRKKNGKRLFGNRTVCWSAGGIIYNHERCSHKPGGLYSSLFLFIWIVSRRSGGTNLHEKSNARGFHVTSSSWLTPVHDRTRKYRNIFLFLSWNEKKGFCCFFQLRSTRCVQQQKDPRGGRFPSCFIFFDGLLNALGFVIFKKRWGVV